MGDSMTQKIYRDGTDQYVMTRLGGIDPDTGAQSILLGESEGDSLDIENLVIVWSEYKKEGEAITPPVITWDSSAGMWKILIPHGNITQYGSVWLNVSGTAMIPVAIEVETVHEISGGSGAEKIIPAANYAFDASAKTLTFSSPYDTLTVEQVTFIKNLTTNYIIWDCRYAGYQTLPIRFGAAPYTHVLSFDSSDSDAANTDKIMIVVNQV